jgi:hypothetical protein
MKIQDGFCRPEEPRNLRLKFGSGPRKLTLIRDEIPVAERESLPIFCVCRGIPKVGNASKRKARLNLHLVPFRKGCQFDSIHGSFGGVDLLPSVGEMPFGWASVNVSSPHERYDGPRHRTNLLVQIMEDCFHGTLEP